MANLVSIPDAADFLDLSEDEVYRLVGNGELEVTIALDLVEDGDAAGGPTTVGPDGTGVMSRMRISSTVLAAYRLSLTQGAA